MSYISTRTITSSSSTARRTSSSAAARISALRRWRPRSTPIPLVSEASVFGVADERLGEVPAAVVYCEAGRLDKDDALRLPRGAARPVQTAGSLLVRRPSRCPSSAPARSTRCRSGSIIGARPRSRHEARQQDGRSFIVGGGRRRDDEELFAASAATAVVLARWLRRYLAANRRQPQIRIANPGSDRLKAAVADLPADHACSRDPAAAASAADGSIGSAISRNMSSWRCGWRFATTAATGRCSSRRTTTSRSATAPSTPQLGLPVCRPLPPLPPDPSAPPGTEPANSSTANAT